MPAAAAVIVRRLARRAAGTVAVAGLLVAGLFGGVAGSASAAAAQPEVSSPAAPMFIVAVPGLVWRDVLTMPALRAFVAQSAIADLSVKSLFGTTRCADGLLTLSAGRRVGHSPPYCVLDAPTLDALRPRNASGPFAADIGAFGQALHDAGLRTAAIGDAAELLLGDRTGRVDAEATDEASAFANGDVVATVLPGLYRAALPARIERRQGVDARFAALLAGAPADATVVVVGVSDLSFGHSQLHVLAMHGGGWTRGTLTSVRRPPFAQLIDLTPTLLATLHVPIPPDIDGHLIHRVSSRQPSISSLVDADVHAVDASRLGSPERLILWLSALLLALLWAASVWWPHLRPLVRTLAWPLAYAPVMTFLAQAVPWWRGGRGLYVAIVIGGSLLLGGLAAWACRRWPSRTAPILLTAGFTVAVLVVDQLAKAPLQFSAPLGDNPLVAGRFRGMGNTDYAFMSASALLVVGALAVLARQGRRRVWLTVAVLVAAVAVVVDGAPMIGDDFGGVLSLLPAALFVVVAALGLRWTRGRIVALTAAAVLVVLAVAIGDYLRPASAQTHVGQFVGDVLHGRAGHIVARKARSSFRSLTNVPSLLAAFSAIGAIVANRSRLWPSDGQPAVQREAVWGVAVLALLGSALNDSGIVIAAFMAGVVVPALALTATSRPAADAALSPPAATPATR